MTIQAKTGLAILPLLLLGGCASLGGGSATDKLPTPDSIAQLKDKDGADRGRVDLFRERDGLRLEIVARGFLPGTYGMHIHTVGRCDAPDFMSAGPHWNPTGAQHGRDNPMGAHRGDLPNLVIEPGLIGRVTMTVADGKLSGDGGLLDADGGSFIIHAQADDLKTDPTGNSGGRVVCGVFSRE
jgi:Cu-Zn family superoxide dismutase